MLIQPSHFQPSHLSLLIHRSIACVEMHSWQSHARHSPARHGDLNFSGGDHSRERLEIRETRHIHQPAHHCGHGAGGLLGKDTASILYSVDLEWVRACVRGVTPLHTRRHRRAVSPRAREFLPVTRTSKMREASAQIQSSSAYTVTVHSLNYLDIAISITFI